MGKVKIRPIEPLILEFEDGKELRCLFGVGALTIITDEFDGTNHIIKSLQADPAGTVAKVLYAGIKSQHEDFTLQEAVNLVAIQGMGFIFDIISNFTNAIETSFDGGLKDKLGEYMKTLKK